MGERFPFDEFERMLRRRVEKIVRDFVGDISSMMESTLRAVGPAFQRPAQRDFITPISDVYVEGDRVIAVIQLPGASKDSIDLRVRDKELDLEAGFSEDLVKKAAGSSIFRSKGYRCTLTLPKDVDPSGAKAIYQDGVLVIELPIQRPKGVQVKVE